MLRSTNQAAIAVVCICIHRFMRSEFINKANILHEYKVINKFMQILNF